MSTFGIRQHRAAMLKASIFLCAFALIPLAAAAAQPDATRTQSEFGYFTGTWRCAEDWSKTDFAPAHKSAATLQARDNLDGVWMVWSYQQKAAPDNPKPAKGADFWGYDPETRKFVRLKIDSSQPGSATQLSSAGWIGDTVAWEGDAKTPRGPLPFKHSFTKIDNRTMTGKLFIAGHQFYESKCVKQAQ